MFMRLIYIVLVLLIFAGCTKSLTPSLKDYTIANMPNRLKALNKSSNGIIYFYIKANDTLKIDQEDFLNEAKARGFVHQFRSTV